MTVFFRGVGVVACAALVLVALVVVLRRPDAKTASSNESKERQRANADALPRKIRSRPQAYGAASRPAPQRFAHRSNAEDEIGESRPDPLVEELVREQEAWTGALEDFDDQDRDPAWASKTEASLSLGLVDLVSRFDGSLESLECRTSQCRAEFAWPDGRTAKSGTYSALYSTFEPNCAHTIKVDRVGQRSTLILDCGSGGIPG